MSNPVSLKRPKLHFDTSASPSHVTFDDGKDQRLNLPWFSYSLSRWDHREPDTIRVEIGEWSMVLRGHNLGPLFLAIEEHTLLRIRAYPDFANEREREIDTFVVEVKFKNTSAKPIGLPGQIEFELPG